MKKTILSILVAIELICSAGANIFLADPNNLRILSFSTDGTYTTFASGFQSAAICFDSSGNLICGDEGGVVRKINTNGVVSIITTLPTQSIRGIAAGRDGLIFAATIKGATTIYKISNNKYSNYVNSIRHCSSLTVNSKGELFVCAEDSYLYKVSTNGTVTTFASGFNQLCTVTADSQDNVYVQDFGYGNNQVYKISKSGLKSSFASISATLGGGQLLAPGGIAADLFNNVYAATGNHSALSSYAHKPTIYYTTNSVLVTNTSTSTTLDPVTGATNVTISSLVNNMLVTNQIIDTFWGMPNTPNIYYTTNSVLVTNTSTSTTVDPSTGATNVTISSTVTNIITTNSVVNTTWGVSNSISKILPNGTKGNFSSDISGPSLAIYVPPVYWTNGFGYSTNTNSVNIIGYNGSDSIVIIPSKIAGLPVTSIDDNSFANKRSITSVSIPNTVTSLGSAVFSGSLKLTTVTIPDSVISFGEGIFSNSPNVTINASQSLIAYLSQNWEALGFRGNALLSLENDGTASGFFVRMENWLLSDNSFISRLAAKILAAPNNYGLAVKQNQSLNFPAILPQTITLGKKYTNNVTSSSGLSVSQASGNTAVATVSGNMLTLVGAGSTVITASQAGNALYNPVSTTQTLVVNKGIQTLNFAAIPAQSYAAGKTLVMSVTSSAGLNPVTYTSANTAVAVVVNNVILLTGKGTSLITASQAGNAYFNPATGSQTLTVK